MSRFVADHLTTPVISALEREDQAIVICTIDEHGWAHPALLSAFEVAMHDRSNVRLALHVSSRSTRNLKANGKLSLILAHEQGVFYVKGDVLLCAPSMRTASHNAKFNLRVDSVLEDNPNEYEKARIVSGIRIERAHIDLAAGRAIRDELLEG